MTEQYQDLYKHLSVGATSLCRPDSVAAALADESEPQVKLEKKEADIVVESAEPAIEEPDLAEKEKDASEPVLDQAADSEKEGVKS